MDDESGNTASISCEPCRQKKCKCDRRLPVCSQCGGALATKCQYPEQSRRGLPTGYLNALESRLAETERALYFALAEMHIGVVEHSDYPDSAMHTATSSAQSKKEMMAKWAMHPLGNRDAVRAWLFDRQTTFSHQLTGAGTGAGGIAGKSLENSRRPPSITTSEEQQASRASIDARDARDSRGSRDAVDAFPWASGFNKPSPSASVASENRESRSRGQQNNSQSSDIADAPQGGKARLLASQNQKTYF